MWHYKKCPVEITLRRSFYRCGPLLVGVWSLRFFLSLVSDPPDLLSTHSWQQLPFVAKSALPGTQLAFFPTQWYFVTRLIFGSSCFECFIHPSELFAHVPFTTSFFGNQQTERITAPVFPALAWAGCRLWNQVSMRLSNLRYSRVAPFPAPLSSLSLWMVWRNLFQNQFLDTCCLPFTLSFKQN